jgi:hypothetical protein
VRHTAMAPPDGAQRVVKFQKTSTGWKAVKTCPPELQSSASQPDEDPWDEDLPELDNSLGKSSSSSRATAASSQSRALQVAVTNFTAGLQGPQGPLKG